MTKREIYLRSRSIPEPNTGCWIWLGAFKGSYPGEGSSTYVNRKTLGLRSPNRLACHTCDQKSCVNPAHLYAGDRFQNARDWVTRAGHPNAAKTRCPKGHKYDGRAINNRRNGFSRTCSTCRKERK
jgi:hypothetical protein